MAKRMFIMRNRVDSPQVYRQRTASRTNKTRTSVKSSERDWLDGGWKSRKFSD
ncbi:hypothetical protein J6590_101225 [Homalodisca vitripennis]|nr:hypothetical protein J6590_101225 [Homalodisca vitripennis]